MADIYVDDSDVISRMKERFKLSSDAENENRNRGLKALKFYRGGDNQWEQSALDIRKNRPHQSYNQCPQFVHQVSNEMRMNMGQTKFVAGNDDDVDVAEAYEDLARAIQVSSEGEIAYDTAAMGQLINGWGYWRYVTEYENDKSFDQVVKIKPIYNPFTVFDDPYAVEYGGLDREFLIEVSDLKRKDYNDQYNEDYSEGDLTAIGNNSPGWANSNSIRVAEYWEVKIEKKTIYSQNGKITKTKPKKRRVQRARGSLT